MTTPADINNFEDLLQIIETNPEWRDALCRRLLTPEQYAAPIQLNHLTKLVAANAQNIADLRAITESHHSSITSYGQRHWNDGLMATPRTIEKAAWWACDEFKLSEPEVLDSKAKRQLIQNLNLASSQRIGFITSDLIFQASDAQGNPAYCSITTSWVITQRHIDLARENADLIRRATGIKGLAAVYGDQYELGLIWDHTLWIPRKH